MDNKPSYIELVQQKEALILESQRLKAAEETFHRQNISLGTWKILNYRI
jgi:hypothetical protein